MKLSSKQLGSGGYFIKIALLNYGCIRVDVFKVKSGRVGYAILDLVTGIAFARHIDEIVKDIRRK